MKTKNYILLFLLLLGSYVASYAQGQLTGGVQTTSLSASIAHWVPSTSDSNRAYYAIASWRGVSGNYLKIYDATTFTATSSQVQISTYSDFTRVRIDNSNNVYVLYHDRVPGKNTYGTFLKKYATNGTLIGGPKLVVNNTDATDIEVAPNGDVLIVGTNGSTVSLIVYRNMILKGYKNIGSITPISNTNPFAVQMDMKGNKFVVAYSYGPAYTSAKRLKINRYNYVPTFTWFINNSTSYGSNYTEYGSRIHYRNNNNVIALRSNWEIFYSVIRGNYSSPIYQVRKINSVNFVSPFQSSNTSGMVDVDVNNRLLISKNYGSVAYANHKVSLYSSSNALIHTYTLDNKIKNHLTSLSIYNCEFVITGIDRLLGANPNNHTYESYHQLFNCKDCRPNMGATAVAKFRYPNQVVQVPSYYGTQDVTELCLVDDLLVDGSLSSCETGYFVGLAEFNLTTWTDINVLHSGWVYPLTQAPNNINIVDFLPTGYHLRPGKIYRFRLAVGSPWHAVDIFFKVSCCRRSIVIEEVEQEIFKEKSNQVKEESNEYEIRKKIEVNIFPNPVGDILNIETNHEQIISYQVMDINGEVILSKNLKQDDNLKSIAVNNFKKGVYLLVLLDKEGKKSTTKFIKR